MLKYSQSIKCIVYKQNFVDNDPGRVFNQNLPSNDVVIRFQMCVFL